MALFCFELPCWCTIPCSQIEQSSTGLIRNLLLRLWIIQEVPASSSNNSTLIWGRLILFQSMRDTLYHDVVPPPFWVGRNIIIEDKTLSIVPLPLLSLFNWSISTTEFCGITAPLWATWRVRFRSIHTAHIRLFDGLFRWHITIVFIHNNTLLFLIIVPNNSHSDDTRRGEGGAPNWHHKTSYSRPWRTQPQGSESTLGLSEVTKIAAFIDWASRKARLILYYN